MINFNKKSSKHQLRFSMKISVFILFTITAPLQAEDTNSTKIQNHGRLSPTDKVQLISLLSYQMNKCIFHKGSAPKISPRITFELGLDGTITVDPELENSSPETTFRPFANSIISALHKCQPYRIPLRFHEAHAEWKRIFLQVDTSEFQDPPKPSKR